MATLGFANVEFLEADLATSPPELNLGQLADLAFMSYVLDLDATDHDEERMAPLVAPYLASGAQCLEQSGALALRFGSFNAAGIGGLARAVYPQWVSH